MTAWNIQPDTEVKEVLFPSKPPWEEIKLQFEWNLASNVRKDQSAEEIRATAIETIETRYSDHLRIYTDGSKVEDSTTAAMYR